MRKRCREHKRQNYPELSEADHVLSITPYVALRYVGSRDDFGIFAATFALYLSVPVFYFSFWAALEILKMERRTFSLGFSSVWDCFKVFHDVSWCFMVFRCRFLLLVTWLNTIRDPRSLHQGGFSAEASGLGHFGRHRGRADPISGGTSGTRKERMKSFSRD